MCADSSSCKMSAIIWSNSGWRLNACNSHKTITRYVPSNDLELLYRPLIIEKSSAPSACMCTSGRQLEEVSQGSKTSQLMRSLPERKTAGAFSYVLMHLHVERFDLLEEPKKVLSREILERILVDKAYTVVASRFVVLMHCFTW